MKYRLSIICFAILYSGCVDKNPIYSDEKNEYIGKMNYNYTENTQEFNSEHDLGKVSNPLETVTFIEKSLNGDSNIIKSSNIQYRKREDSIIINYETKEFKGHLLTEAWWQGTYEGPFLKEEQVIEPKAWQLHKIDFNSSTKYYNLWPPGVPIKIFDIKAKLKIDWRHPAQPNWALLFNGTDKRDFDSEAEVIYSKQYPSRWDAKAYGEHSAYNAYVNYFGETYTENQAW